jgi:hypothetical protein
MSAFANRSTANLLGAKTASSKINAQDSTAGHSTSAYLTLKDAAMSLRVGRLRPCSAEAFRLRTPFAMNTALA